jgi:hypothetical protein
LCPAREPKTFSGKRLDSFYRHKCFQSEEQHTYLKPNILETANYPFIMLGFNLKKCDGVSNWLLVCGKTNDIR